jgi:hypothetical protein
MTAPTPARPAAGRAEAPEEALDAAGRAWLAAARADPHWQARFAEAGRSTGAGEAARILLLLAVAPEAAALVRLYRQGTPAERGAVLRALPDLDLDPEHGVALVEDALRTHDTRLIAAAVGPYAGRHLGPHAWRHAVLKCLFTGVPVAAVANLADRCAGDGELRRMLLSFAAERAAAGRPVPEDLRRVLELTTLEP